MEYFRFTLLPPRGGFISNYFHVLAVYFQNLLINRSAEQQATENYRKVICASLQIQRTYLLHLYRSFSAHTNGLTRWGKTVGTKSRNVHTLMYCQTLINGIYFCVYEFSCSFEEDCVHVASEKYLTIDIFDNLWTWLCHVCLHKLSKLRIFGSTQSVIRP